MEPGNLAARRQTRVRRKKGTAGGGESPQPSPPPAAMAAPARQMTSAAVWLRLPGARRGTAAGCYQPCPSRWQGCLDGASAATLAPHPVQHPRPAGGHSAKRKGIVEPGPSSPPKGYGTSPLCCRPSQCLHLEHHCAAEADPQPAATSAAHPPLSIAMCSAAARGPPSSRCCGQNRAASRAWPARRLSPLASRPPKRPLLGSAPSATSHCPSPLLRPSPVAAVPVVRSTAMPSAHLVVRSAPSTQSASSAASRHPAASGS
mmetsp:Transcript_65/g.219  ORF Transcript_65/g.219 Transcript_65/m.219 type:complete len:260 (-) Transcript_65:2656-3435(-)